MPKKSSFVDFKAVKTAITMEQVLEHYDLLNKFKRSGDSLAGPCPIHGGTNPTQFRVSISKNIWNCFSECKHGGNTLDFIAHMEDVSIHKAALKAVEWFGLNPEAVASDSEQLADEPDDSKIKRPAKNSAPPPPENSEPNKPLKFSLDKLNRSHPYLAERGLTPETVIDFGIGYCEKGMMAQRIAIPIHNSKGEVVAYAGRIADVKDNGTDKYKLPPGFKKSQELFNVDRAIREPQNQPLVIVEGFFDCMILHQRGCRKVVALMGSTLSFAQEQLIRMHTTRESLVIVMLDEDEAGQNGREDIAVRLSKFVFVKVHEFEKPGTQPEDLSAEEIARLTGGRN